MLMERESGRSSIFSSSSLTFLIFQISIFSFNYAANPHPTKSILSSSLENEGFKDRIDFSNGFPSGFAQGLPSFDFSGPITSNSPSKEETADTENIGFVHGPPKGFPSLHSFGVNFPAFEDDVASIKHENGKPQISNHHSSSNEHYYEINDPQSYHHQSDETAYLEDHRSASLRNPISSGSTKYNPRQQYSIPEQSKESTKPIVLKVSSKRTRPTQLPPPPPPFYAPSPDFKNNRATQIYGAEGRYVQNYHQSRQKRETNRKKLDQEADGTEVTYWKHNTPSSYIAFDNYEKSKKENISSRSELDPQTEEQRFFPAFPPSNPYLSLHPFLSSSPARPPLFPGPSANRAPTRAHPKYSYVSIPSSNHHRGPLSSIYSSKDNDDRGQLRYLDSNLLGSGNFEVVRGGTFYEDTDDGYHSFHGGNLHHSTGDNNEDDYYHHHNGHSSGSGYRSPTSDFFANFRDFADINPHSRSYSHNIESISSEGVNLKKINDKSNLGLDRRIDDSGAEYSSHLPTIYKDKDDPMLATF